MDSYMFFKLRLEYNGWCPFIIIPLPCPELLPQPTKIHLKGNLREKQSWGEKECQTDRQTEIKKELKKKKENYMKTKHDNFKAREDIVTG